MPVHAGNTAAALGDVEAKLEKTAAELGGGLAAVALAFAYTAAVQANIRVDALRRHHRNRRIRHRAASPSAVTSRIPTTQEPDGTVLGRGLGTESHHQGGGTPEQALVAGGIRCRTQVTSTAIAAAATRAMVSGLFPMK